MTHKYSYGVSVSQKCSRYFQQGPPNLYGLMDQASQVNRACSAERNNLILLFYVRMCTEQASLARLKIGRFRERICERKLELACQQKDTQDLPFNTKR